MSWLTSVLSGLSSTLSTLTPTQLKAVTGMLGQGSNTVTQAVESQEIELLTQIQTNPAAASAALATLTGLKGVPPAAISLVDDALAAWAAKDTVSFNTGMASAKAIVLQQKIGSGLGGLFG